MSLMLYQQKLFTVSEVLEKVLPTDLDEAEFMQHSWMMSSDDRKSALYSFCQDIISEYVDLSMSSSSCENNDKVQEYAKEIMTLGILYLNYKGAIREGDTEKEF